MSAVSRLAVLTALALGPCACGAPPDVTTAAPAVDPHAPTAAPVTEAPLASVIQNKGRGATLPVAGADFVRPAHHIDLLASVTDPADGETVTVTLLQNVVVLAAGALPPAHDADSARARIFGTRALTLLLLPEEVELAIHGASAGALHAAPRNTGDIDIQEERGRATLNTLLTGERCRALNGLRQRLFPRTRCISRLRRSTRLPAP